jgi:hypothetical protein
MRGQRPRTARPRPRGTPLEGEQAHCLKSDKVGLSARMPPRTLVQGELRKELGPLDTCQSVHALLHDNHIVTRQRRIVAHARSAVRFIRQDHGIDKSSAALLAFMDQRVFGQKRPVRARLPKPFCNVRFVLAQGYPPINLDGLGEGFCLSGLLVNCSWIALSMMLPCLL